jgi:hypothetical protein
MTVYTSIQRVDIEAITFEEIHEYAEESGSGSVNWMGHIVTVLDADCVVVTTNTGTHNFMPDEMLITSVLHDLCGGLCICKLDIFGELFYLADEDKQ